MSELPKEKVDEIFAGMVEKLEDERPKTTTEITASLADRFRKGEMPVSLDELKEQEAGIGEKWQEAGFGRVATYLDEEGNSVIVAPLADNVRDRAFSKIKTEKTWRFLVDGEEITVTVPPELQGTSANFRSSRGYNSIYRLPDNEELELTEGMQQLVGKFGPELGRRHNGQEVTLGGRVALGSVVSRIDMDEKNARRQEQEETQRKYNDDETEAWRIHEAANHASVKVKQGLFMRATTHEALRLKAYKDEVDRQLNNPH